MKDAQTALILSDPASNLLFGDLLWMIMLYYGIDLCLYFTNCNQIIV